MTIDLTRRELLVSGAAAAGFALVVHPISAETIVTDAGGLTAGMVSVPAGVVREVRRRLATRSVQSPICDSRCRVKWSSGKSCSMNCEP
jgi:hypothetical protein